MRVLVTGANGQVGSELTNSVLAKKLNIDVLAYGRKQLDISSFSQVENVLNHERPVVLINTAAYTAVDKAEQEQETAYAINEKGPENLAIICQRLNIILIHISTDYIFDGTKLGAYTELDTPNPTGVYGKSKLAGEIAVNSNIDRHFILRVAWVFGEYGNNFVKTMLRLANEKKELSIVADQKGSPTWAKDIADVCLLLAVKAMAMSVEFGTYHFVGNRETTWFHFAENTFNMANARGYINTKPALTAITSAQYPTPAQRPLNSVLNCNKIEKALGIPLSNWQLGLEHVLEKWK